MSEKVRDPARSPKRRREDTYEAFESKVVLLEEWVENGLPYKAYFPESHAALRKWTGPEGMFGTWIDPTIDRVGTGKYPNLAQRYADAIGKIKSRPNKVSGQLADAIEMISHLQSQNAALVIQNADLISRLDNMERRSRLLKSIDHARSA